METREIMKKLDVYSSQIESAYQYIAKAYGLTYNELMLLYTVDESGEITQQAAAEALFLPRSSIHTILGSLMKKEYLTVVDGRNLKEKNIVFTDSGRERMARIESVTEQIEDSALQSVSPSDMDVVLRAADALARSMSSAAEQMFKISPKGDEA